MKVTLEFSGGMELLFNNQKSIQAELPSGMNLSQVIIWIKDNLLQERPELFIQDNSV